jgi:dipeptidase
VKILSQLNSLKYLNMKKIYAIASLLMAIIVFSTTTSQACTNYLVTRGASTDGSNMITYAADSHVLYGELYFRPAADWAEGTMIDVYEWDTGKYLGQIPQVPHTYSVVGNMNEFQLAIGETTYGGRSELGTGKQEGALIDYGSLIYLTLQRAKNAREAIKVMTELVEAHGYYSSGESFSISDKNEIWILEMIGKGNGEKGAVWVARMIPDGYVSGHANQARITTFPLEGKNSISSDKMDKIFNPEVTNVYAKDVISFAKEKGYYPKDGKNKEFSFSDTYAPVDFGAARFCEIRVWSFFNDVKEGMDKHFDYCKGKVEHDDKGYATNRMPLWIKPDEKVDVLELMDHMRNHLEGTELDMAKDMGAGPYGNPYRWRPLTWKVDGVTYCNERATATQQTGFSFVTQSRNWLPDAVGGINWFGVDDAASSVYFPMYCGSTRVPKSFAVGNGKMMEFTNKSAFWVFNQVTNFAYTRYNAIHPEIAKKQKALEKKYLSFTKIIDLAAEGMFKTDEAAAVEFLTDFSCNQGDNLTDEWREFYGYLFAKFMDGNIKEKDGDQQNPKMKQPGYSKEYYETIVKTTGDKLKVSGASH